MAPPPPATRGPEGACFTSLRPAQAAMPGATHRWGEGAPPHFTHGAAWLDSLRWISGPPATFSGPPLGHPPHAPDISPSLAQRGHAWLTPAEPPGTQTL
eukprot:7665221-Pyramimonas_sp.AAC.1